MQALCKRGLMFHEAIFTVRVLTLKAGFWKAVVSLMWVLMLWSNDDLDLESCVIRYHSCTSLQGGCINSLWESRQREVSLRLHLPFSPCRVCLKDHMPAYAAFIWGLRLKRLSCVSRCSPGPVAQLIWAPLSPQMLSPLFISASVSPAACLYLLPTLFYSL